MEKPLSNLSLLALALLCGHAQDVPGGRTLDVRVHDAVYMAASNRIYAVLTADSPRHPRSLVEIDPDTLNIERSLELPRPADRLAPSPDGSFLYAYGRVNESDVYRIAVEALTIEGEYKPSYPDDMGGVTQRFYDLLPLPGTAESYLVARRDETVALYDRGTARPKALTVTRMTNLIASGEEGLIFGYQGLTSEWGLRRIRVHEDGLEYEGEALRGAAWGYQRPLELRGKLLYAANGTVFDLQDNKTAGWFRSPDVMFASAFAIDEPGGKIYFSSRSGVGNSYLSYDLRTFLPLGYLRVENHLTEEYRLPGKAQRMLLTAAGDLVVFDDYGQSRMLFIPTRALAPLAGWSPESVRAEQISPYLRRLAIPASYITADPANGKLYATVQGRVPEGGNRLIAIDVRSGAIEWSLYAGPEPGPPAPTSSGRHVYVPLLGLKAVRKFSVPDRSEVETVWLKAVSEGGEFRPGDPISPDQVLPLPGSEESWAVTQTGDPEPPIPIYNFDAVVVYDGASRRPAIVDKLQGPTLNSTAITQDGRILGLTSEVSTFPFWLLRVTPEGAVREGAVSGAGVDFGEWLTCDDALCATNLGNIIDADLPNVVARLPALGPSAVDRETRRVYVAPYTGPSRPAQSLELLEYDIDTARLLRRAAYPIQARASALVRWANDQFAVLSDAGILLISTQALEPAAAAPMAPPTVTGSVTRFPLTVKSAAFDPHRGLLYAAVDAFSKAHPNEIVALDPRTGSVVKSIAVGSGPALLRVTGDGRFLYAGLTTGLAVVRVDLENWHLDSRIPVKGSPSILEVPPDRNDTFILGLGAGPLILRGSGVIPEPGLFVYRDGARLPAALAATPEWALVVDSSTVVTPAGRYRVTDSGLELEQAAAGRVLSAKGQAAAEGLLFGGGSIGSATELRLKFQLDEYGRALPDPARGRIYYLRREGIRVYDWTTLQVIGFLPFPFDNAMSSLTELILCGEDRLAVVQDDTLYVVHLGGVRWAGASRERPVDRSIDGVKRIALRAAALHYDSRRGVLYAATPPEEGALGNSIVAIDPATGAVRDAIFAGAIPSAMAMDAGGSRLFVGLRGARGIVELDLGSRARAGRFDLPNAAPTDDFWPVGLAVMPNTQNVLAVSAYGSRFGLFWTWRQMILEPDGAPRPETTGATPFNEVRADRIFFNSGGSRLQAMGAMEPSLRWSLPVGPDGVRHAPALGEQRERGGAVCGGEVFNSDGVIYDLETMQQTGSIALPRDGLPLWVESAVACDASRDRLYFLRSYYGNTGRMTHELLTYRLGSRELLELRALPQREGKVVLMEAAGEAGVAYWISVDPPYPGRVQYPGSLALSPVPPDELIIAGTP
jgi:DNA-binding beta-propeller fold protein YncE